MKKFDSFCIGIYDIASFKLGMIIFMTELE